LEFLRLGFETARGLSGRTDGARAPNSREVQLLHAFFRAQDPPAAAEFRTLAISRGWVGDDAGGEVAGELLADGQREAAVEWLAHLLVQRRFPPPLPNGKHRFPTPRRQPDDYLLDEYLPAAALELIARQRLALPVLAAIDAIPGADDPVLRGFLRFYDDPRIETFQRHLGTLTSPANPHLANTLRIRVPYLLARLSHTKDLARQLAEAAGRP
jgi:hypothetical protein